MNATEAKAWLSSIVKQRTLLIKRNQCKANSKLCATITERLKRYLDAYPLKGDVVFRFIRRHYSDILIIIPGNKSQDKNLKILNQCAKMSQTSQTENLQLQDHSLFCSC
jgi:hypothetical protein